MTNKIFHFVKVRFDKRTKEITQEWLDTRYEFFINHTLKSLRTQTNTDWLLWINCQKGMNKSALKLESALDAIGQPYVITFGDGPVSPQQLEPLGMYMHLMDSKLVYVTRIDSDDLYAPDALELARYTFPKENRGTEASMFRRGYLHDMKNNRTGVYHSPSGPFHTLMIPSALFTDSDKYHQYVWRLAGDHSKVNTVFPTQVLPDWKFTVLIHGNNFVSDFEYGREHQGYIPRNWSIDNFINPPVVFDVDDFCDDKNCLDDLAILKETYPNFKCTLFTIPGKTSLELLKKARDTGYIELCPHGITHEPNEELKARSPEELAQYLSKIDDRYYTKGFRPPGWFISVPQAQTLSELGYWIACHERDTTKIAPYCEHGYYVCGQRFPYAHHHTHNVCNNWIRNDLTKLVIKWPVDQKFAYVSEALLVPSS